MKKINRIVKAKQKNKLFAAVLGALLVFCFTASAFASNDVVPGSADVGPEISAAGGLQAGEASESPSDNALQLPEASASPTQAEDKEQAEGAIRITTLEEFRRIGISGGLAAEIRQAKKIQNVQVYVHNPNEGKLDGAFVGKADAAAEVYENCLWSGAYANSAFGIDSPVDAADGVTTLKSDPAYVTLGTGGQQARVTADTQSANQFGLAFQGWQGSETILALGSTEGAAVTITSKEETGAEDVEAVYAKTWPDGEKTEVRFFTPVIISQSISVEKELEPIDPIFPNQISGVQPLMPAGSVLPLQIGAEDGVAEEEQPQISITRNPDDQTGEIGESVTFSVEAEGDNLAYQWQQSMDGGQTWTDIPGATEREYTFTAAEEDYAKEFRCAVRPAQ